MSEGSAEQKGPISVVSNLEGLNPAGLKAAQLRSEQVPVDEQRIDEMFEAMKGDPDPDGDITVGILKSPGS